MDIKSSSFGPIDLVDYFFQQGRLTDIGDDITLRSDDPLSVLIARRAGFEKDTTLPDHWVKRSLPRWTITWARAGAVNMNGWHDLFESCFGYRMPRELERWKYLQQDCLGILVFNGEKPVAFYGGLSREILYFGIARSAVQICDVMVHPHERGVLTRNGPFFLATATFLENKIGLGKKYFLGFGFPSNRHMQIAQKMQLYEPVGEIVQVAWKSAKQLCAPLRYSFQKVDDDCLHEVDRLWKNMSVTFKDRIIGVRNSERVKYRYLDHPTNCYTVLLVKSRWNGKAFGILVFREHDDTLELIDIIAPITAIYNLIVIARDWAARVVRKNVYAWMTAPDAKKYSGSDGIITPLDIFVPTSIWTSNINPAPLKDKWWLMAGDSDFR